MFNIFIDPNIKAERTQFSDENALFLSIVLGSFAEAMQVLSLIAWSLEGRKDWEVKSASYEGGTLEVRIVRTAAEEPAEGDPASDS